MADITMPEPEAHSASQISVPDSPPSSVVPSPALSAVPALDSRSVSTPTSSSISTFSTSTRSRESRLSDGATTVIKRRGYMRPQGTAFADSARNRDSVMSLGSIAHMQYYFARTGLLDGKGGGQLAKTDRKKSGSSEKENVEPAIVQDDLMPALSLNEDASNYAVSESGYDRSLVESPTEAMELSWDATGTTMLPPTVSTYKLRPSYTEPLPDMPVLRRELKEALQDACKVLEESQKHILTPMQDQQGANGFYEIQGLHLLDIITLAIRAARNYYTSHSDHERLYAIKSERQIRSELYQALEVLKRMASRNFRGGMRLDELSGILIWIESIDQLLKAEERQEQQEAHEREVWTWRQGDWTGREREREWLFLKSYDATEPALPRWPEPADDAQRPNAFLQCLQDGQRLVKLHNSLVERSRRRFEKIKNWHSDVAKPYRMAENLRYWQKAAELRFDVHLNLPISEVVNGTAWEAFDAGVYKWCQTVRTELVHEWAQDELVRASRQKPPELKVEPVKDDIDETSASSALDQPVDAPPMVLSDPAAPVFLPQTDPEPVQPSGYAHADTSPIDQVVAPSMTSIESETKLGALADEPKSVIPPAAVATSQHAADTERNLLSPALNGYAKYWHGLDSSEIMNEDTLSAPSN